MEEKMGQKSFKMLYLLIVDSPPFIDNKALTAKLRNTKKQLIADLKRTEVPSIGIQGLYHILLHKLRHVDMIG